MDNIQVSENIREDLKAFTDALRNSREYLEYRESAEEVEKDEALKEKLAEYRLMNYNLQQEMAIEISKLSSVIDGVHGVKGVSS